MARVRRLKGAILARTEDRYFLVGSPKEPLDFAAEGFKDPGQIEAPRVPYIELFATQKPSKGEAETLLLDLEGEALARKLALSFMIERNGSISERLWHLVTETTEKKVGEAFDVNWLSETPEDVWDIVRDSVLRC